LRSVDVEWRPSGILAIYPEGVMYTKKKWSELSGRSRSLIVAVGVVEVILLAATLIDIKRRPADQIKGSKRMWTALAFINIVGPISYFTFGRRRSAGV
jgi:bacteriorhodopsin